MGKILEFKPKVPQDTVKLKEMSDALDALIMKAYTEDGLEMREILYVMSDRLGKATQFTADPVLMVDLMSDLMYAKASTTNLTPDDDGGNDVA